MLPKVQSDFDMGKGFAELMRVGEAAKALGVHPDTIRRWVKQGKLRCVRHPINQYRLFYLEDLKQLVAQVFGHE